VGELSGAALAGIVVGAHGRHCVVETPDGDRVLCHPKGKKNQAVVGDRVRWQPTGDEGTIEAVQERRNLLYRQDEARTKSFAANLDQILLLLAADPEFSESQLTRALIAAREAGIPALVVLNKRDLQPAFDRAWGRLAPYRDMGETVLPLCLKSDDGTIEEIRQRLLQRTTLVLGPSGAGKSTLINRLIPKANASTGEISKALNSGKHTTTTSTWYWLDDKRQTALIDSPGFQEFGLQHINATRLAHLMPDLEAELGTCRFYNCTHLHEPGCAVQKAVGESITSQRYRLYNELFAELSAPARY
jgi:ribosome biogenesis GTPase / thiamine phosphate phosphatase